MINLCARKKPEEIVRSIIESLETESLNTHGIASKAGISWATAWKYLRMIQWIQACPKVRSESGGKRIDIWRIERGKLPE